MPSLKVKGHSTRSKVASRGRFSDLTADWVLISRQRAHDGNGPMGFKRININSKQRCIMGAAVHILVGEEKKNK